MESNSSPEPMQVQSNETPPQPKSPSFVEKLREMWKSFSVANQQKELDADLAQAHAEADSGLNGNAAATTEAMPSTENKVA